MALEPLKEPKFVTFPVTYDPNFGSYGEAKEVSEDPKWVEAAASIVYDPQDSRERRLSELRNELKNNNICLQPGDDNQLLGMLRAGQGHVGRAMQVIEVFLKYQQYDKLGKYCHYLSIVNNNGTGWSLLNLLTRRAGTHKPARAWRAGTTASTNRRSSAQWHFY